MMNFDRGIAVEKAGIMTKAHGNAQYSIKKEKTFGRKVFTPTHSWLQSLDANVLDLLYVAIQTGMLDKKEFEKSLRLADLYLRNKEQVDQETLLKEINKMNKNSTFAQEIIDSLKKFHGL